MGAGDRQKWSSLARQDTVEAVAAQILDAHFYGAAVLGAPGAGKTSLARNVEIMLEDSAHFIKLFGNDLGMDVPYGVFSVLLAQLTPRQTESQSNIMEAMDQLLAAESKGRRTVIVLDDLPSVDMASMGLLMHLLLSGTAKLLVLARQMTDLPEDIVWMIKDKRLMENRLEPFSRGEVRSLLGKALGGTVVESVVGGLFDPSAGNPQVLHALVNECLAQGLLRNRGGIWVLDDVPASSPDGALSGVVASRLAREGPEVNNGIKKMALLKRLPLSFALPALGEDVFIELEERGMIVVGHDAQRTVSLKEPFVGETVRGWMTAAEKALLLQELSNIINVDPACMGMSELLIYAAWVHEAGRALEPATAIGAARAANHLNEPKLAMDLCAHVPRGHGLEVQAARACSRAYYILGNYPKAVAVLEEIDPGTLAKTDPVEQSLWACDLVSALLWVSDGYLRSEQVLAEMAQRQQAASTDDRGTAAATKYLNLARYELLVHRGDFALVSEELELASRCADDRAYALNCACLLTMVLAATGRELEAIELAKSIDKEATRFELLLRFMDWRLQGLLFALTWSGQWRSCEALLLERIGQRCGILRYRGGVSELALGVAYAYAGRGTQAIDQLLIAVAQLEVRNIWHGLGLAYAGLAFAFTQIDDAKDAAKYLDLARKSSAKTLWVHRSQAHLFQRMAQQCLGDDMAHGHVMAAAVEDAGQGKFTTAAMGFFVASHSGTAEVHQWLEETSRQCQGPLAAIHVGLARAHRSANADHALRGAAQAESLELLNVEFRCAEVALELARDAGDNKAATSAQQRLMRLAPQLAAGPTSPQAPPVKLTHREMQIAGLARDGHGNRAIASTIGVSVRTVEGHLYQVFTKLGISSRSELESFGGL